MFPYKTEIEGFDESWQLIHGSYREQDGCWIYLGKKTANLFIDNNILLVKKDAYAILQGDGVEFLCEKKHEDKIRKYFEVYNEIKDFYKSLYGKDKGDINLIDAYSTDSEIITNDLVILEDDMHLFPPYQGAPLMRAETLDEYPQLEDILNQLAGQITTQEMLEMNYAVDVEGRSPNEVAVEYLRSKGLLGE